MTPTVVSLTPKIDDTNVLNDNIKKLLLERHPEMKAENIIGAYGGVKQLNPENNLMERTREMRGEEIAHAYMYNTNSDLPNNEWGNRYWDALKLLKNQGVKHIVVGFSQVVSDSVLTLVEMPNQIGKEIGIKTWIKYTQKDLKTTLASATPLLNTGETGSTQMVSEQNIP